MATMPANLRVYGTPGGGQLLLLPNPLVTYVIQSHLVITKAKNSGSFVRYSEVSEEIPYSEVYLYGSMGVNFQKVHS